MKNAAVTRTPIASFPLPPGQPEGVVEAEREFDRVATEWASTNGAIADAREAAKQAQADAKHKAIEAAMSGKATKTSVVAVETEHLARVAELEAKAEALSAALDEVGNTLARAIGSGRDSWVATLERLDTEFAGRFSTLIGEAQQVAREWAKIRGGLVWLRGFDTGEAIVGRISAWHGGGRLDVEGDPAGPLRGEHQVAKLLALAAKAATPPAPPKSRRHRVAAR